MDVAIGGLILRGSLNNGLPLYLLRDAPADMDDVTVDVRPPERVDFALAHTREVGDIEEDIAGSVGWIAYGFLGGGDVGLELVGSVELELVLRGLKIDLFEVAELFKGILWQVVHFDSEIEQGAELAVDVLPGDNGEVLLVDGVFPFLELICIQLVDAGVGKIGKNMTIQNAGGFEEGSLADLGALGFDELGIQLVKCHRSGGGELAHAGEDGLLREFGFGRTVDDFGFGFIIPVRVGVVDKDAITLFAVFGFAGFVDGHGGSFRFP